LPAVVALPELADATVNEVVLQRRKPLPCRHFRRQWRWWAPTRFCWGFWMVRPRWRWRSSPKTRRRSTLDPSRLQRPTARN
jgi:hypothetical protein